MRSFACFLQSHVPTDQNRGRKRKHDEAGGEDGATTGPWGEGCEQVVNDELAGAREDSVRAQSFYLITSSLVPLGGVWQFWDEVLPMLATPVEVMSNSVRH